MATRGSSTSRPAGSPARWPKGQSRSWPASRVSRRTARTSPRSAGAVRTPRRWRWPRRWAPTSARSTPTWTGSSPPIRGSCAARRIPRISYEEMLEMAACGAKILHLRCVEYARRYDIPIHVRSSFSNREGTWVVKWSAGESEGDDVEQAIISGVAHDRKEAKITVVGVPDKVGEAARIFRAIAAADINIDMIVQNVSAVATGRTDISFTLPSTDGQVAMTTLRRMQQEVGYESLLYDDKIGKISLVGAGMRSHPGVSATFFGALAGAGVNIGMISTSEIRISVVVDEQDVDLAVNATHKAFDLDAGEDEAVVYGGTGR